MTEARETRRMRLSSTVRGLLIVALIAFYGYVTHQPGASLTATLLIAAALQGVVLLLRRFVSPELLPQALDLFELLADAATVFLFALGVYGGILAYGLDAI